ncbi:MAG: fibrobacter succinogenes major paralogous domain-containing protein [Patescibacteria group bacterium]|nr:fibrobacter succinogenes major paralogous domain-containing protein [Patescibacteria group bacterium]
MKIKNIFFQKIILASAFLMFLLFGFLFFKHSLKPILAQSNTSDAIAVRIIPNPNHLSAQRWYESQGFSGSPQSLLVDGYKAIRDGRTVYVSATNIIGNNLYTNIYLISYNQEADQQTVDIFGKIIDNWKFNTNLTDIGTCSISNKICYENNDCEAGYICGNSGPQKNKCVLSDSTNAPNCLIDSQCPNNLFCDSKKSKVIRDLDRLEKLMLLNDKINQYKQKNGIYPILGSGTYLSHVAVSTWPSWQNTFLNQIEASNALDPINKLGSCADDDKKFNLETCWNPIDSVFATSSVNINHSNFILPAESYAIAYVSNSNGSDYKLCANMETKNDNYQITEGVLADHNCSLASSVGNIGLTGNYSNTAPYISEISLDGESGQEFKGFIKVSDAENNSISWGSLDFGSTVFTNWSGIPPQLLNTSNPNQKMIYASKAGNAGDYSFTLNIGDNIGSSTTHSLKLSISNPGAQIIAGNIFHNISNYIPLENFISINSNDGIFSIEVCLLSSQNNCVQSSSYIIFSPSVNKPCSGSGVSIGNNLIACADISSGKNYLLKIISGLPSLGEYKYRIMVEDIYGKTNQKDINVKVIADNPIINFNNCSIVANLGSYYECDLKTVNPLDNSEFSTTTKALPKGLLLDKQDNKIKGYLLEIGAGQEIEVKAETKLGTSVVDSFSLNVISDCENNLVQYDGGPWNYSGSSRSHSGFYKTVLIGNQCWLKDNLNIGTQVLGSHNNFDNNSVEKYCYKDESLNCDIYGGLYNFTETMNILDSCKNSGADGCKYYNLKGICPPGWRVPADSDWYILENYLKDTAESCNFNRNGDLNNTSASWDCSSAGAKLKYLGSSGFNALFINYFLNSGSTFVAPDDAYASFWTSTYNNNSQAITRHLEKLSSNFKVARIISNSKSNAYSVRCIKDFNQCQEDSECLYLGANFKCLSNICATESSGGAVNPINPNITQ